MNWKNKRVEEINKICGIKPSVADIFVDEVYAIWDSKAKSYEDFKKEFERSEDDKKRK